MYLDASLIIYNKLPKLTISNNVTIGALGKEGILQAKSINGIYSMRDKSLIYSFGNPYTNNIKLNNLIITPDIKTAVLKYIHYLLELPTNKNLYNNHSGGAFGADSKFEEIGKINGYLNHNHYYYGNKTPNGNKKITLDEYEEGLLRVNIASIKLKKKPVRDEVLALLARNWIQVKNSTQIIAIARIEGNNVIGGTGWAVAMAQTDIAYREINVFNMLDNEWYIWIDNKFIKSACPILHANYAGIGSREITDTGILAIKEVYDKSNKIIDNLSFIRNVINNKLLKNRKILYYKELYEPSHANALDYIINKLN